MVSCFAFWAVILQASCQELSLSRNLGISVSGSNSGSNRVSKPQDDEKETIEDENDTNDLSIGSYLMVDEFDGFGRQEVNVNIGDEEINDIQPKDIERRKQDRNMPRPLGLQKRKATEKSITFRFQPPQGSSDVFSHYQVILEHPIKTDLNIYRSINKLDLNITRVPQIAKEFYYVEVIDQSFRQGILYMVTIQTMVNTGPGLYILSSVVDDFDSGQKQSMRTLPPPITSLEIGKTEQLARSIDVKITSPPTMQIGPIYNYFEINLWEVKGPDGRIGISHKILTHKTDQSYLNFNPRPVEYDLSFSDLTTGTQYVIEINTVSDGGSGLRGTPPTDKTESKIVAQTYTVSFDGPKNITKTEFDSTSMTLEWIAMEMEGISHYEVEHQQIFPTDPVTFGEKVNATFEAQTPNGGVAESATIDNLEPGFLYIIAISSLRENYLNGNKSEPSIEYFQTQPEVPNAANITITLDTDFDIPTDGTDGSTASMVRSANMTWPELGGHINYFCTNYTNVDDTTQIIGPRCIKWTQDHFFEMNNLLPGALYNVSFEAGSRMQNDVDPTRSRVYKLFRTKPNPPRSARADSTRGTIHLSWHRPDGMSNVGGWQYRLRYILDDVDPWEENQPEEKVKYIPAGQGSDSTSSIPRRDDFLSRLLSGRKYSIVIETVAGSGEDAIISDPLGPMTVYTQPEQPKIEEWLQITTDHIKVTWLPPESKEGKFDQYYLNVTRRRERYPAVDFKNEFFHKSFGKNESFYVMEITAGAVYNMTLTSIVGTGDRMLESIVTNDNKRSEIKTWSAYVMHSTFKRLEWKFTSCGQIGRIGPTQQQCDAAYESKNLKKLVQVKHGIQEWLAPIKGLYRITAAGPGYERTGGLGGTISGTFDFNQGDKLQIVVGQRGDYFGNMVVGGAGGSFVLTSGDSTPLVVSGGAGSSEPGTPPSEESNAMLNQVGRDASETGINFGLGGIRGGRGLRGSIGTGGGAGLTEDGDKPLVKGPRDSTDPAIALHGNGSFDANADELPPGAGGKYLTVMGDFSEGGFGGGGAGFIDASGGGGGYSGGAGGPSKGYSGGGGCFLKYTGGRQLAALDNADEGYVKIALIGLPKQDPVPMELYLSLSFILGMGVAAWCGCLMAWISKCMDWIIGEDEQLISRQRLREQIIRSKQQQQEADYEIAIQEATIKRFMEDQESGFSSEGSAEKSNKKSIRRRKSTATKQREAEERRGRSPIRRGRPQRVPYRMADAGSPPPSTKPPKSNRPSFRSIVSDIASVISMTKLASDIVEEVEEELQVIIEHDQNNYNRDGYIIPKVKTIDDPNDVVTAYQRHYQTPKELEGTERREQFGQHVQNFKKAADKYGTAMFMGNEGDGAIPLVPVAKLGENTKLDPANIHDGYAAAFVQSRSHHAKKAKPKTEVVIDFPCERLPTPPETDYENYDSEEEERKKNEREMAIRKAKMTPKSSNQTKAAFGAGKHILHKMQEDGWKVAPGGQLVKPPVVPATRRDVNKKPILVKTQDSAINLDSAANDPSPDEPPKKSPKLEAKKIVPKKMASNKIVQKAVTEPVEPEIHGGFSLQNEINKSKLAQTKAQSKDQKLSDAEELPGHLNYNAPVFDRMRDRVAREKAEARKKNPFASATETENETEIEFEDHDDVGIELITDGETTTDFDEDDRPSPIKPKPLNQDKLSNPNSISQSSRSRASKRETDNSEILSEMSDLSDIPTLSDLAESEIDEDMKTVKELMGATNSLDTKIADIHLSTDDETQSELRLTDIDQATEQKGSDSDSDGYEYPMSMVSRLTGGTVKPGPGYNTGTMKSNISGYTDRGDEPRIEDLFSDESSSDNSDNLPLPTPTPPRKPAIPSTNPVSRASLEHARNTATSPFGGIQLKPIAQKVNTPMATSLPAKKPIIKTRMEHATTDDDAMSDASKTESLSDDLGATTEQESDWPEPTPIKPKILSNDTETESDWPEPTPIKPKIISKPIVPKVNTSMATPKYGLERANNTAASPFGGIQLKPIAPKVNTPMATSLPAKKPIIKTRMEHATTDDDALSDASKTESISDVSVTTEQESDWPEPTPIKPKVLSIETETDSDWPEPTPIKPKILKPMVIKPNTVKPSFTKQPLPIRPITPKLNQSTTKFPAPKNSAFDQLKPLSPNKKTAHHTEDIPTDVLSDASDTEGSVLSDGMTTGHDSDYLTTV